MGDVTENHCLHRGSYLFDNNLSKTRFDFRAETTSLIAQSSNKEGILSLEEVLNEYISLKRLKIMVDQERVRLEMEMSRVHTLLQRMHNAMSVFNASRSSPVPVIPAVATTPAIMAPANLRP